MARGDPGQCSPGRLLLFLPDRGKLQNYMPKPYQETIFGHRMLKLWVYRSAV